MRLELHELISPGASRIHAHLVILAGWLQTTGSDAGFLTLYSHNAIPIANAINVLDATRINASCDTARYIYLASKLTYRYIPFHGTVRFDSEQGQSRLFRKLNLLRNGRCRNENPPSIHRIYCGAEIGIHARFEHVAGGACVKSSPNELQFLVNRQEDDL